MKGQNDSKARHADLLSGWDSITATTLATVLFHFVNLLTITPRSLTKACDKGVSRHCSGDPGSDRVAPRRLPSPYRVSQGEVASRETSVDKGTAKGRTGTKEKRLRKFW